MSLNVSFFQVVPSHSLAKHTYFRKNLPLPPSRYAVKMEAASSTKTLVKFYQSAWRQNVAIVYHLKTSFIFVILQHQNRFRNTCLKNAKQVKDDSCDNGQYDQ
jgi:hypothetical protein